MFGEDVLGDEDESGDECTKNAEEVARKLGAASQNNTKCKGYEGEVCSGRVADVVDEAVRQNGEEWREAFNGMHERYRDLLCSCGRKYVPADLEECQG